MVSVETTTPGGDLVLESRGARNRCAFPSSSVPVSLAHRCGLDVFSLQGEDVVCLAASPNSDKHRSPFIAACSDVRGNSWPYLVGS